jgi:catechol 2,3-dioxygenase
MSPRIGHAHLKVRDLDRAVSFYERFLGQRVRERVGRIVFLSASDIHHELALQEVGPRAVAPGAGSVGLFHVAFEVPDKAALSECYRKLRDGGISVASVDHRISWALYFSDPDGNGLEIYCDTRTLADGSELWEGLDRRLSAAELLRE